LSQFNSASCQDPPGCFHPPTAPPSCFHPPTYQIPAGCFHPPAQQPAPVAWNHTCPQLHGNKDSKSAHTKRESHVESPTADMPGERLTTLMLRDLPNDYTRDMLVELLESSTCKGCYDFVYLPYDFKKKTNLGWARVNMLTHPDARKAFRDLRGFSAWKIPSQKVLSVSWSKPLQGLAANVDDCRNSAVMHPDVPEQFKPLLLENGCPVSLPAPTRPVPSPHGTEDEALEGEAALMRTFPS